MADTDSNTDKETASQTQNVVKRIQKKWEKKNYIEELDEEDIPTKKKKQQEVKKVSSPKLSWFKENVIKKISKRGKKWRQAEAEVVPSSSLVKIRLS